jgi:hypothetical protein
MMPDRPSRRLLHLLTSPKSAGAIAVAVEQQRAGAGAPLLVIGPAALDVTVPGGIEAVRLADSGTAGTIGYGELLRLIDEASSVSVW